MTTCSVTYHRSLEKNTVLNYLGKLILAGHYIQIFDPRMPPSPNQNQPFQQAL